MECPYCGQEMIEGELDAARPDGLFWLPEGEDRPLILTRRGIEKRGGVWLCGSMEALPVWRCPGCKKLIASYE
jgi:predicted RNA-binding Zn-ribbon protein involved in translation (DUF1610 family)